MILLRAMATKRRYIAWTDGRSKDFNLGRKLRRQLRDLRDLDRELWYSDRQIEALMDGGGDGLARFDKFIEVQMELHKDHIIASWRNNNLRDDKAV